MRPLANVKFDFKLYLSLSTKEPNLRLHDKLIDNVSAYHFMLTETSIHFHAKRPSSAPDPYALPDAVSLHPVLLQPQGELAAPQDPAGGPTQALAEASADHLALAAYDRPA